MTSQNEEFPPVSTEIAEMVRRIVERFAPERIILFGSYARGTAGPDSDADILVIMHLNGSRRGTRLAIRALLRDIDLAKDIIVATPDEVELYRDQVGTLIRPALQEGRVLYERAA
jgi:uncharacterized protein